MNEKTLKEELIYKGKILNLKRIEVSLDTGVESVREIVEHKGAVAIVVFEDNKFLFVKQYRKAFEEILLEIPAGKLEDGEDHLDCAKRELEEETGLRNIYLEQLYTMSQPDRDPRMRVIDIAYMALVPETKVEGKVKAGDDAKEALWFDIRFTDRNLILRNEDRNIEIRYNLKKKSFKKYKDYYYYISSAKKQSKFVHSFYIRTVYR